MNKTSIEWVQNPDGSQGYTWNPITGCFNGCEYCYALKLANGRLKQRYLANKNYPTYITGGMKIKLLTEPEDDPFYPRFWPERVEELKKRNWREQYIAHWPRGIFVCDMGELFGDWLPREWQDSVFQAIRDNDCDRFYLLTKQPQNLIKWSPFPDNCWVGVTATNQDMFDEALFYLDRIEATIRYISFEPLLERVRDLCWNKYSDSWLKDYVDWLIIGAQTKPYKPPQTEWIGEIVEAAGKAGIAIFLKDNLEPLWTLGNSREPFFKFTRSSPGAIEIGRLRQEMPE